MTGFPYAAVVLVEIIFGSSGIDEDVFGDGPVIGIKGSQGSGLQFPAPAVAGIDAMLPLACGVLAPLLGVVAEGEGGSEAATLGFEQRQVEVEVAAKQVDIFAHGAPVVAGGPDAGAPDVALVEGWRGDVHSSDGAYVGVPIHGDELKQVSGVGLEGVVAEGGVALKADVGSVAVHLIAPDADAVCAVACALPLHIDAIPEDGGGDLRGGYGGGGGAVQRSDCSQGDGGVGVAGDANSGFAAGEAVVDEVHVVDAVDIEQELVAGGGHGADGHAIVAGDLGVAELRDGAVLRQVAVECGCALAVDPGGVQDLERVEAAGGGVAVGEGVLSGFEVKEIADIDGGGECVGRRDRNVESGRGFVLAGAVWHIDFRDERNAA